VLESHIADMQTPNWLAAGYLGDQAWLERLRRSTGNSGVSMPEAAALLSPALLEESSQRMVTNPANRRGMLWTIAGWQGRPDAARGYADTSWVDDPAIFGSMFGERTAAEGMAAVRDLEAKALTTPGSIARRTCTTQLWHEWMRDGTARAVLPSRENLLSCTAMVELVRAWHDRVPDLAARLEAADSLVRRRLSPASFQGYEHLVLARIWEDQGNRRRALSALRAYSLGVGSFAMAYGRREEGRLAAALGQVDRAIEAYRQYLALRKYAEPALQSEVDSVRAVLARLVRQ
jgi:hypothetical protein